MLHGLVSVILALDNCAKAFTTKPLETNTRHIYINIFIVPYVSVCSASIEHLYSLSPSFSLDLSAKAELCMAGLNCSLFSQVGEYGFESLPTTL